MHACLDTLLTGLYVLADDFFVPRRGPGRPPKLSDAELVCLAVAQVLLDCPGDRRFLAWAGYRLRHLFPYLPKQPGYNKRIRALAPRVVRLLNLIVFESPSIGDRVWLVDGTSVPCGASRETARRSELAGYAAYGFCRSQHRHFWGFKLVLCCAPDGMPIGFELIPANVDERKAAREILERLPVAGHLIVADKGYAGREFEQFVAALGGRLLRPDRKDEPRRHGSLGGIRQWIESIIDTCKGQLSLERHGGRTMPGLIARVLQRLLALAAVIRHNQLGGIWERTLIAYDH
jgi:Transposase DDE domain